VRLRQIKQVKDTPGSDSLKRGKPKWFERKAEI
jgi:hypothetical protein